MVRSLFCSFLAVQPGQPSLLSRSQEAMVVGWYNQSVLFSFSPVSGSAGKLHRPRQIGFLPDYPASNKHGSGPSPVCRGT